MKAKKTVVTLTTIIVTVELAVIAWSIYDMLANGNTLYGTICMALVIPFSVLGMVADPDEKDMKDRKACTWLVFHILSLLVGGMMGMLIPIVLNEVWYYALLICGLIATIPVLAVFALYKGLQKMVKISY